MTQEQHDMYETLSYMIERGENQKSNYIPLRLRKSLDRWWNVFIDENDWYAFDSGSAESKANMNEILLLSEEFANKIGPLFERRLEILKKERDEL